MQGLQILSCKLIKDVGTNARRPAKQVGHEPSTRRIPDCSSLNPGYFGQETLADLPKYLKTRERPPLHPPNAAL